jgi:hypothetical protein
MPSGHCLQGMRISPTDRLREHLIRDEADFNRHIEYTHWNTSGTR